MLHTHIKNKVDLLTIINFNIKFKVKSFTIDLNKSLIPTLDTLDKIYEDFQYDLLDYEENDEYRDIQIYL